MTPDASVIVALNAGNVVQNVLFSNLVYVMVGPEKSLTVPANSTAPQSGVAGLVVPKISVVTDANGTALLSAKLVPLGAYIPVDTKNKLFPVYVLAPLGPATALKLLHEVLKLGSFVKL